MVTHLFMPRRNSNNFVPSFTLKTLMTVPFSLAVAILVPWWLNANAASGLSCAAIIVFECYANAIDDEQGRTTVWILVVGLYSVYLRGLWHRISALRLWCWIRDRPDSNCRCSSTNYIVPPNLEECLVWYAELSYREYCVCEANLPDIPPNAVTPISINPSLVPSVQAFLAELVF